MYPSFIKKFCTLKGFTLIELLVVISIVGLLSSIVFAALGPARGKARDAKRIATLTQVQKALELYYDKYGAYPYNYNYTENGRSDSCQTTDTTGIPMGDWDWVMGLLVTEKFLPSIPKDPLNTSLTGANRSCFKYSTQTTDNGYRRCSTSGVLADIPISDYTYVLFFSSEQTNFNLPLGYWPGENIYEYCLFGPKK